MEVNITTRKTRTYIKLSVDLREYCLTIRALDRYAKDQEIAAESIKNSNPSNNAHFTFREDSKLAKLMANKMDSELMKRWNKQK